MNDIGPAFDADTSLPARSGRIDQALHHDRMRPAKILAVSGIQGIEQLVGGKGIAHFLDLAGCAENPFPVQDGGDLFKAQGVTFDIQ
jgi:hypothetical protein